MSNILIDDFGNGSIRVYVGDFGQADKMGGTPGWTPPEFISDREAVLSDMYSFGLLILFILCENVELFYAIRDNSILNQHKNEVWYNDFMNLPAVLLILDMTRAERSLRPSLESVQQQWAKIKSSLQMITSHLINFPSQYLTAQGPDSLTSREKLSFKLLF